MISKYKYIYFLLVTKKTKTSVYKCLNIKSNAELGIVKWNPGWRQYCYFPSCPAVYSKGCLEDINNFIDQIEDLRKGKP